MNLKFLQKLFVTFSHPAKIIGHIISLLLLFYSLWVHWVAGIIISLIIMLISDIYAYHVFDFKKQFSTIERYLVHAAEPQRFLWIVFGFLMMCYGLWMRQVPLLIFSVILETTVIIYVMVYQP